jgi:hypothetical protein
VRSYKEGDWWVTTPVYVGSAEEIAEAEQCAHEFHEERSAFYGGPVTIFERCQRCCASRVRYKQEPE